MEHTDASCEEALKAFAFQGTPVCCSAYGNGHINGTYRVDCQGAGGGKHYILQDINTKVFARPEELMQNIGWVTEYLKEKIKEEGGDPERETLTIVPAKSGGLFFRDSSGRCWRSYVFITDAVTYERAESTREFFLCGRALGHFQQQLAEYPVERLAETIPDFHHTPKRLEALKRAAAEDVCGRNSSVRKELRFFLDREEETAAAVSLHAAGKLPLRVTHNDTKLNNILFDKRTGKPLCIIDLDTIMSGFSAFDFGDAIRSGASTASEDERDLSRVSLSLDLYDAFSEGFLKGCGGSLTETEKEMLPMGAKLMTMECGIRFLTDYLQGDRYFRIHRPHQNLDRARTQIALAADMERKWERMRVSIEKF